ncbi:MAG: hypothetical protein REU00_02585 [Pseudomonadota bacterium]|nr:hypothetical protein [Pseudomonadota bacterium]
MKGLLARIMHALMGATRVGRILFPALVQPVPNQCIDVQQKTFDPTPLFTTMHPIAYN